MNFDLKNPCNTCPFRYDRHGFLMEQRAQEIANHDGTFACHKTIKASLHERHNPENEQHCAGFLIMREHMQKPNQTMRIAERLGLYDYQQLNMLAPIFKNREDFVAFHVTKHSQTQPDQA